MYPFYDNEADKRGDDVLAIQDIHIHNWKREYCDLFAKKRAGIKINLERAEFLEQELLSFGLYLPDRIS